MEDSSLTLAENLRVVLRKRLFTNRIIIHCANGFDELWESEDTATVVAIRNKDAVMSLQMLFTIRPPVNTITWYPSGTVESVLQGKYWGITIDLPMDEDSCNALRYNLDVSKCLRTSVFNQQVYQTVDGVEYYLQSLIVNTLASTNASENSLDETDVNG